MICRWLEGRREQRINLILELLSDERWHYGLDLVKASNGKLRRGTIYSHLADMVLSGLIDHRQERNAGLVDRLPRTMYRIAPLGIARTHRPVECPPLTGGVGQAKALPERNRETY